MSFNDVQLLGTFGHDSVTNSLQEPDSAEDFTESVGSFPLTTVALYTGPKPLFITHLMVNFSDVAVTDPTADLYLGWAILSASAGGGSPSYSSVVGYTANADLPHIHDNSVSTTAIQAVANVPVNLLAYVGNGAELTYATQALQPAKSRSPIRVAANCLYQVRLGTYLAGTLTAVTGLDNVTILVYGKRA